MKDRPFFENLDTSFVNLEALVRYLRRRKFIGMIRVRFTGYEGEIVFTSEGKLRVKENDNVAGQAADGENAFNSILVRAKEPGGIVNVVQSIHETPQKERSTAAEMAAVGGAKRVTINGNGGFEGNGIHVKGFHDVTGTANEQSSGLPEATVMNGGFPFELSNHVEEKPRSSRAPINDYDLLVDLTGELLKTIDGALERAGLDFSAAFEMACSDVSDKYPFLAPEKHMFKYSSGVVYVNQETDLQLFPKSLGDALARIFARLGSTPKFGKVNRFAVQKVRSLVQSRREQFDRTQMTPQIERALGA